MRFLPQKTLKTIDTADEIQFLLVQRPSWLRYAIPLPFIALLVWQASGSFDLAALFGAGILALIAFASWIGSDRTLLQVTRELITAHGDLGQPPNEQVAFEPASLDAIGYSDGLAGRPSGLYATQGWTFHCLMPGLTEAECRQVVDAIYRKFPGIEIGGPRYHGLSLVN
ncbi:hypothetical protein [Silvibacterium dinghuense]|uniref:Uncharacterized protein n=1 Tax=Silvibacterium dinghuense TaxID=1560006 RepID=A0A4V1NVV9_9BACT|nr:hypothetical protein [Silvibacterium dinghuense]RXS97282.1 hypothetical protein ESZ00_05060 [Silvibacterium dinghuense]